MCSNNLKGNKLKVYISLKGNKLACFANSEDSLQVHASVHDFWKKYHEVHVSSWCKGHLKSHQVGAQKNIKPEFLILSALKLPSFDLRISPYSVRMRENTDEK